MRALVLAAALGVLSGCAPANDAGVVSQPYSPLARFQRVNAHLFRGSQPDRRGFRFLAQLGVRTVINLRSEADAIQTDEHRIVESLGMRYVHLPVKDGSFFTRSRTIPVDTIRAFLAIVDDPQTWPVFVHCRRGADRTGALVGFYRIARDGWDGERAYAEARAGGMRSWYTGLRRQIETFDGSRFPVTSATGR